MLSLYCLRMNQDHLMGQRDDMSGDAKHTAAQYQSILEKTFIWLDVVSVLQVRVCVCVCHARLCCC